MIVEIYTTCKFCLFDGAYLLYGVVVFAVSLLVYSADTSATPVPVRQNRRPPMPGGELLLSGIEPPKTSIVAKIVALVLAFANFSFFLMIARFAYRVIRSIFLLKDHPTPLRSFWRYFNIYYLVILLPAAFMPPSAHPQRSPDFHLLAAVVLLICVNALGDLVSVRVVLRIFRRFLPFMNPEQQPPTVGLKEEATYYVAVLVGALCSLGVLVCVLICSSILYGVQIGQMDFSLSEEFVANAWDRARRFPELLTTMYWFRNQPGPFGWTGVPGLFIYGLTTFIPILIFGFLAAVWLLLIPFRIAVNLPPTTSPVLRVISAEAAVLLLCVVTSLFAGRFLFS